MQTQKSTRRKREDPQSRDFICRCGKTYLSYAAAYTHIKNKHNLDKQFLDNVVRPAHQKLPRGRPKQSKSQFIDRQYERLSLVQTTILKMYTMLHSHFPKMILQANTTQTLEQLQKADQQLLKLVNVPNSFIQDRKCQDIHFIQEISKHFVAQIASKLKFVVFAICQAQSQSLNQDSHQNKSIVSYLNSCNFWGGVDGVNELIYDSFSKWRLLR